MRYAFHIMLNDQFLGDKRQIESILYELSTRHGDPIKSYEYQDSDVDSVTRLQQNLVTDKVERSIIFLSGSHGYQFITKPEIQELLKKMPKPIIVWVGHQDPGLIKQQQLFDVVALPAHIVEEKSLLTFIFNNRLVIMEGVPNTLQKEVLAPALKKWNETYPTEKILNIKQGVIGVFLGGSAPTPDGIYLHDNLEDLYQRGINFAQLAMSQNKRLLIVNGPRTGKFYYESPDAKDPIIRQFNEYGWIAFEQLTDEQKTITINTLTAIPEEKRKIINKTLAHSHNAPIDPETQAFIQGIIASGLTQNQYQVFDFQATPGQLTKSGYNAAIAEIYNNKENSIVCYSGESISYAEISYLIPKTFAFITKTMNNGHVNALKRFSEKLHKIGVLNASKPITDQLQITFDEKNTQQEDAKIIVDTIEQLLAVRAIQNIFRNKKKPKF